MSVFLKKWETHDSTGNDMGIFLAEQIAKCTQIDILTGYFFFDGITEVQKALFANKNIKLRILVGMDAGIDVRGLVGRVYEHELENHLQDVSEQYIKTLETFFAKFPSEQITPAQAALFAEFSDMIKENRLEIKKTAIANHSKLYIFHEENGTTSFCGGSSNFSYSGLTGRQEFNIHVEQDQERAQEVQKAFDVLWKEALPITDFIEHKNTSELKPPLHEIIRQNNPCATVSPFDAYIKIMHEYLKMHESSVEVKQRIREILEHAFYTTADGKKHRYQELAYQVDAVADAAKILQLCGGVIIADVVGLGKSVIASLLAKLSCKPGIFLVPAHLIPNWLDYLVHFNLDNWHVMSIDNPASLEGDEFKNAEMVVIDEAHNLRNPKIQIYQTLQAGLVQRDVVLLTATPFNNKPEDLWSLINLIGKMDKGNLKKEFENQGDKYNEIVENFRTLYNNELSKVSEKEWKEFNKISAEIRRLVSPYIIRRNRIDLTHAESPYKDLMKGKIPKQESVRQDFCLTQGQAEFYEKILNQYFAGDHKEFKGAMYQPQVYVSGDKDKQDGSQSQTNLYGMICRFMVCRWESSPAAFLKTLKTLQRALKQYISLFKSGKFFIQIFDRNKAVDDGESDGTISDEEISDEEISDEKVEPLLKKLEGSKKKKTVYCQKGCRYDFQKTGATVVEMNETTAEQFLQDMKDDYQTLQKIETELIKCGCITQESDGKNVTLKAANDGKFLALKEVLRQILAGAYEKDGDVCKEDDPRKAIVFSGFADTAKYIETNLEEDPEFKGKIQFVQGKDHTTQEKRLQMYKLIESHFRASGKMAKERDKMILVCTDVLSEGVNLNQAGVVINYDLSYNPVRVIQRIGRINRIEAKVFENIYSVNFFPSEKDINGMEGIAIRKMHAIHSIVCEDAQVLSLDERPLAALSGKTDSEKLEAAFNAEQSPTGELSIIRKMYQDGLKQYSTETVAQEAFRQKLDLLTGRFSMVAGAQNSLYLFYRDGFSISAVELQNVHDTKSHCRKVFLPEALKQFAVPTATESMPFELSEKNSYYNAKVCYESGEGFYPEDMPSPNAIDDIVKKCSEKFGINGINAKEKLRLFVQTAAGMEQVKNWLKENNKTALEEALNNYSPEKLIHKNNREFFMAVGSVAGEKK